MATRDQLYTALRNADKAGDVDAARKLAAHIQSLPAESANDSAAGVSAPAVQRLPAEKMMQNLVGGAIRGAGSIGATLLAPRDAAEAGIAKMMGGNLPAPDRRQGMTDALGSMGVDTDSMAFGAGKLGAEIAGTLGTGGAIARGLSAVPGVAAAAPNLLNSIRSAGMTATGGNAMQNALLRAAGGTVTGWAAAGLVNPEDAGMGAAVGGALPNVAKGIGWLGQKAGQVVTRSGAERVAADRAAEAVGDVPRAIKGLRRPGIIGAEDIPLSAAAKLRNENLAVLEQGSRLRVAPQWYQFDQTQGRKAFENVIQATKEADDLGNRFTNRAANWAKNWKQAEGSADPAVWVKRMGQLGADIETALKSPDASNPEVRRVVDALKNEVIRVGEGFSPAHLQRIRAEFNGRMVPGDANAFKAAPRDNAAVRSLIAEMDDILNTTTGGRWDAVRQGYAQDSSGVRASKAAGQVRQSFIDPSTGRIRGVSLDPNGDVAKVTEAGLGRAIDAARMPDKTLALSPAAEQQLTATIEALRRQNIVQGVKRTATAGGGSDTASNAVSLARAVPGGGMSKNVLMSVLDAAQRAGTMKTDSAIARILSDPNKLAEALEGYLARNQAPPAMLSQLAARAAPVAIGGR